MEILGNVWTGKLYSCIKPCCKHGITISTFHTATMWVGVGEIELFNIQGMFDHNHSVAKAASATGHRLLWCGFVSWPSLLFHLITFGDYSAHLSLSICQENKYCSFILYIILSTHNGVRQSFQLKKHILLSILFLVS